jgi:hypothetical protein
MASRGSTRLSQPHAGLIDVDKLDAGLFESGAHDIDRSLLQLWRRGRVRESRGQRARDSRTHLSGEPVFHRLPSAAKCDLCLRVQWQPWGYRTPGCCITVSAGPRRRKQSRFDGRIAQLVEQLPQRVHGSSPCARTIEINRLRLF